MTDFISVCRTCLYYKMKEGICAENSSLLEKGPKDWCGRWRFTVKRQDWINAPSGTLKPGEDPHT